MTLHKWQTVLKSMETISIKELVHVLKKLWTSIAENSIMSGHTVMQLNFMDESLYPWESWAPISFEIPVATDERRIYHLCTHTQSIVTHPAIYSVKVQHEFVIASDKIPYAVSAHSQWQCTLTPAALNLLSSYKLLSIPFGIYRKAWPLKI